MKIKGQRLKHNDQLSTVTKKVSDVVTIIINEINYFFLKYLVRMAEKQTICLCRKTIYYNKKRDHRLTDQLRSYKSDSLITHIIYLILNIV